MKEPQTGHIFGMIYLNILTHPLCLSVSSFPDEFLNQQITEEEKSRFVLHWKRSGKRHEEDTRRLVCSSVSKGCIRAAEKKRKDTDQAAFRPRWKKLFELLYSALNREMDDIKKVVPRSGQKADSELLKTCCKPSVWSVSASSLALLFTCIKRCGQVSPSRDVCLCCKANHL